MLIFLGADLSQLPKGADSPVFWCLKEGRNDILALLVQAAEGADVTVVDDEVCMCVCVCVCVWGWFMFKI